MISPQPTWKRWIVNNASYKVVALFITLILWVTILGRRDFVFMRDMGVEVILPPPYVVMQSVTPSTVQVKVSGSRMALKRFAQSPSVIVLDLPQVTKGSRQVIIPHEAVELPTGVRILTITPNRVSVQIGEGPNR